MTGMDLNCRSLGDSLELVGVSYFNYLKGLNKMCLFILKTLECETANKNGLPRFRRIVCFDFARMA